MHFHPRPKCVSALFAISSSSASTSLPFYEREVVLRRTHCLSTCLPSADCSRRAAWCWSPNEVVPTAAAPPWRSFRLSRNQRPRSSSPIRSRLPSRRETFSMNSFVTMFVPWDPRLDRLSKTTTVQKFSTRWSGCEILLRYVLSRFKEQTSEKLRMSLNNSVHFSCRLGERRVLVAIRRLLRKQPRPLTSFRLLQVPCLTKTCFSSVELLRIF